MQGGFEERYRCSGSVPWVQADEEDASGEWIGGEPSCVVPSCEISGLGGNAEDRGRDSSDRGSLGELSDKRAYLGIPSVVIGVISVSNILVACAVVVGRIITVSNISAVFTSSEGGIITRSISFMVLFSAEGRIITRSDMFVCRIIGIFKEQKVY